jgi:hypothetical protein
MQNLVVYLILGFFFVKKMTILLGPFISCLFYFFFPFIFASPLVLDFFFYEKGLPRFMLVKIDQSNKN